MERRGAFDYILLETTGLADPGNIAPLFWVDEGLGSTIYLDGIVTLVDAKNILRSLDEKPQASESNVDVDIDEHEGHEASPEMTTAHLQISHADVLVVNKSDLVSSEQLETVLNRLQAINGLAKIHVTQHGQVPQLEGMLLDLHAYDDVGSLETTTRGHSHLDPTISTTTLPLPALNPTQLPSLDAWLRSILWDSHLPLPRTNRPPSPPPPHSSSSQPKSTFEIHRLKGLIPLTDGSTKMIQGVREVFEIIDVRDGAKGQGGEQAKGGKIVLIGRGLEDFDWSESLVVWLRG
ncbi:MAG: hypothetical protein M1827_004033 [Pycnora praestabilis]|nr:MAG: hypothetical protein M1827_004033 [Pycnora praestabilis]